MSNKINIKTREFGEITVEKEDVIKFTSGLYGFEQYKNYVILKDEPEDDIMFLQSLDNPDLSFVLIDPYVVLNSYETEMLKDDLKELNVKSERELKFLIIAIINENIKNSVINLKSPIALNPKTRIAKQVILQNNYPLRYNFVAEEEQKC